MRDEQQRFARATEEGVEPFERGHVEMIGRLVQEEQLRILQQQGRQRGAHLPASGQIGGGPRELRPRESEPTEDLLRPVPAVELLVVRKLLVQFCELAAQLDLLLLRRRLRQSRLHGGKAPLQPGAPGDAGEHPIDDRSGRQLRKLLRQIPGARPVHELHGAPVRLDLAGEDLQQGALAAAIRADQAGAVVVAEREARAVEEHLGPVADREGARVQQRHRSPGAKEHGFSPSPSPPASG